MSVENSPQKKKKQVLFIVLAFLVIVVISGVILTMIIWQGRDPVSQGQELPGTSSPTLPGASPTSMLTPTPFFFDDFADNAKEWALTREDNTTGYQRLLRDNQMILGSTNGLTLVQNIPTNASYEDFVLTTTFTFLSGDANDSLGLYLRGDRTLDHNYRIDIFGDNTLAITKEFLGPDDETHTMMLRERAQTPLLNADGESNVLTVMMKGPYLYILLNGEVAIAIVDADYIQGQIALFVRNGATSEGVSVAFDQIEIKAVPVEATPTSMLTPTPTTESW